MGKVTKLEITLANDVNVFPLGDTIKGEVVVEVSDEKDRGLNKVKGKNLIYTVLSYVPAISLYQT